MSVIIDFSIFPMDKSGQSLSPYVARALDIIKESGLKHSLGPMGTCIEGDWDDVMGVVNACYRELEKDSDRIYINIKADCRAGREDGMASKVRAVRDKQR